MAVIKIQFPIQLPSRDSIKIFSFRSVLIPGCHDGTFEPDFRTVQSSFSTLIYMGVNKKTLDSVNFFNYRVIPNNEATSFLIERLTTSTSDYMPSNGVRLGSADMGNIRKWIQRWLS
jgi:hypothetical protein